MRPSKYAEIYGLYNHPKSPVTLARSSLCDGWGVFATRDLPEDMTVTYYEGTFVRDRAITVEEDAYTFEIDPENAPDGQPGWCLVGESDVAKLDGKGLAQMVNDAIHPSITGLENNCRFVFKGTRVYLHTVHQIQAGSELLASYGIPYWIDRFNEPSLSERARRMLGAHVRVQGLFEHGWLIERFDGFERAPHTVLHVGYCMKNEDDPDAELKFKKSDVPCNLPRTRSGAVNVVLRLTRENDDTQVALMCPVCSSAMPLGSALSLEGMWQE